MLQTVKMACSVTASPKTGCFSVPPPSRPSIPDDAAKVAFISVPLGRCLSVSNRRTARNILGIYPYQRIPRSAIFPTIAVTEKRPSSKLDAKHARSLPKGQYDTEFLPKVLNGLDSLKRSCLAATIGNVFAALLLRGNLVFPITSPGSAQNWLPDDHEPCRTPLPQNAGMLLAHEERRKKASDYRARCRSAKLSEHEKDLLERAQEGDTT